MTRFIAELGSNHGGDLQRAVDLINAAKGAGFDSVKVQCFDPARMFRSGTITKAKHFPCPIEWLPQLSALANSLGMEFGATVCNIEYLNIETVIRSCDFVKCNSYDLLRHDLIRALAGTRKPLLLSTGMATLKEVKATATLLPDSATLLHCVSIYPCPVEKANLSRIAKLRSIWSGAVGYSDHTCNHATIIRAVNHWKAESVELHLDLDDAEGVETKHSLSPDIAECIIRELRMDGDGSDCPSEEEQAERKWRADPINSMRPMRESDIGWN